VNQPFRASPAGMVDLPHYGKIRIFDKKEEAEEKKQMELF
jgi:hypothetical protein